MVLNLRRDRGVDGPVAEPFPVEAVEPPETIIKILVSCGLWEMVQLFSYMILVEQNINRT